MTSEGLNRRHVLAGAAAAGVGLPVLAACGEDEPPTEATETPNGDTQESPTEGGSPTETGGGGGGPLASTSEIPVGGGEVFADQKVVVTQPAEGDFKGFTAVCTHRGCLVSSVTETINCPCHGSMYSLTDGSVQGGPAPAPLAPVEITVQGGQISLA